MNTNLVTRETVVKGQTETTTATAVEDEYTTEGSYRILWFVEGVDNGSSGAWSTVEDAQLALARMTSDDNPYRRGMVGRIALVAQTTKVVRTDVVTVTYV